MTSRTETALQALVTALRGQAALPAPMRNDVLVSRLLEVGDGLAAHLNVWDGEGDVTDETLGADLADPDDDAGSGVYEIEHRAIVEFALVGGEAAVREAAFDAGLIAIHDAVRADNSSGAPVFLGGVVDRAAIERVTRSGLGLVSDGMPAVKAAEITVVLVFTSPRPF